jgi:uncharacterized iron-regulated membrane protein
MKESFTRSMAFLHTWGGLITGWLLFSIFFTGALSVFYEEITSWATPQLHQVRPIGRIEAIERGVAELERIAPGSRLWRIVAPDERERALELQWRDEDGKTQTRRINPATGETAVSTIGGSMFIRYHYRLHLDREKEPIGFWIVGFAGIAMLVMAVSGIVIHKRIFRDFFLFRSGSSRQRTWTDAHNVLSVLPLPFHILITLSGLLVYYWLYMPAGVATLYDGKAQSFRDEITYSAYRTYDAPAGPAATAVPIGRLLAHAEALIGRDDLASVYIKDPGTRTAQVEIWGRRDTHITQQVDRVRFDGSSGRVLESVTSRPPVITTQSFLVGLHFALFGGSPMRWLYFVCGLAGAGTIASGLLLFVIKRRDRRGPAPAALDWAERLNVGAIMGPIAASIASLWAMRLLPADLAARTSWETTSFFAAFALSVLVAVALPPRKAWPLLLQGSGLLCLALPLADLAAPTALAPLAILRGDWALASVEIVAILGGLLLLTLARRSASYTPKARATAAKAVAA